MEYDGPDEATSRNSPLLVSRNKPILEQPTPLKPWNFYRKSILEYEPPKFKEFLGNEFFSCPSSDDSNSRRSNNHNSQARDTEGEVHESMTQESGSNESLGQKPAKPLSLTNDSSPKPIHLAPRRERRRLGLPLMVFTDTKTKSVIACPDSGSDDNIMSRKLADQLGVQVMDIQSSAPTNFVLANGRTVSAVGQVHLKCAFRKAISDSGLMDCVFYVFQTLAVPMIMGIEFLHATETSTKHRDRLVEELVPPMRPLRVCSVGRPNRNIICRVGNHVGCATADTGSDLDLVSLDFAASRAFDVEDSCVELEFADGSTGYTVGMIKTAFCIGRVSDIEGFVPKSKEVPLELFLLNNLNADILLGTGTIQDLQAFSGHEDCFIPVMSRLGESELNIIRYIGAVERGFSQMWGLLKDSLNSTENKQAAAANQDHKRKLLQQHDQLLYDQLYNRGRLQSIEASPNAGLPHRELSVPSLQDPLGPESLTPRITPLPGMFNEPLQWPHSLISFASPRSSTNSLVPRPLSCPVIYPSPRSSTNSLVPRPLSCPVMNNSLRHCPFHESTLYACPYCPGRDHAYTRPDNLQ